MVKVVCFTFVNEGIHLDRSCFQHCSDQTFFILIVKLAIFFISLPFKNILVENIGKIVKKVVRLLTMSNIILIIEF